MSGLFGPPNLFNRIRINDIGTPGQAGYGVGVCPGPLPDGMTPMAGYTDPLSPGYGGYLYSDGSYMRWIPAYWEKVGTGTNGLPVNRRDIKPFNFFALEATANAAGYRLPMDFRNAGVIQPGYFLDEFPCSNNGGIASSLPLGNPLTFHADHNPVSGLTGAPPNIYASAIPAAKTRGADFIPMHLGMGTSLLTIATTHASAASSTAFCAWYDPTGEANFPKGCNNNALGDANDATLTFISDGYSNCAKTGSANHLAKTAHNGQLCGIKDVSGPVWHAELGITSDGTDFYVVKPNIDWTTRTNGTTLATDMWGATGIAANYDSLGATYGPLQASSSLKRLGLTTQTFSHATSGLAYMAACLGVPLSADTVGTNQFGLDGIWDYRPNQMSTLRRGSWNSDSGAGVGALYLNYTRSNASSSVGFRAALYLRNP